MTYFHLIGPEPWVIQPHPRAIEDLVARGVLCGLCRRISAMKGQCGVDVRFATKLRPVTNDHLWEVTGHGFAVVRRDILDLILAATEPNGIFVGAVMDSDGREVVSHRTIWSQWMVHERHQHIRVVVQCAQCGLIGVAGMPGDTPYLLRHELHPRRLHLNDCGGLFVSDVVRGSIPAAQLLPLSWQPVVVRNTPGDGLRLPTDPPSFPGQSVDEWLAGR